MIFLGGENAGVMLHISLDEVQAAMPKMKVYAWRFTHHPELGVYRAMLWMELPYKDADKVRYDRYFPSSLAISKESVLKFLKRELKTEFKSERKLGLKKV